MKRFKGLGRAAAMGALCAVMSPVFAAEPSAAAPTAPAAPAGSLAEAQQRLEQAAKDVARLSGASGEQREVRVVRVQRGPKGAAGEGETVEIAGPMEGLPGGIPAGAHVMVFREGGPGAPGGPGGPVILGGPGGPGGPGGMHRRGPHGFAGPGLENVEWTVEGPLADLELATLSPTLGRYFGADKGILVVRANNLLKLQDGDVLRAIGGRAPADEHHALRILGSYAPGEAVKLEVLRERKTVQLDATLPAAPEGMVKRRVRVQMGPPPAP